MVVEKALNRDIDTLAALRIAFLREDHYDLTDHDADVIFQELPEYFDVHLNQDLFCYVVRDGETIVSCAYLLVVEKPMNPAFLNGKTGIVMNVYTRPAFRRRGYAGRIIETLLEDAKRMDLCTVELKATDAGYPLYWAAGFVDDISDYHPMRWNNHSVSSTLCCSRKN